MSQVETAEAQGLRFPNESAEYRTARNGLLEAEIALRRHTEEVAAMRRALPPGGEVPEDYAFEIGDLAREIKLSALFGDKSVLFVYSYMFGPKMERPCPSCTSMLDALDGEAPHITQRVALAVVARSPIQRVLAFTRARGWSHLRLLSSANNSYNLDYHGEDEDGAQWPIMNVFSRDADGVIRHRYATELMAAPRDPGEDPRHIDSLWPLWGVLDLSPEGRGDFRPKLEYADDRGDAS